MTTLLPQNMRRQMCARFLPSCGGGGGGGAPMAAQSPSAATSAQAANLPTPVTPVGTGKVAAG
jgi:hypothetical protein